MPATYSISVGQPTKALRKQDIYPVLLLIQMGYLRLYQFTDLSP